MVSLDGPLTPPVFSPVSFGIFSACLEAGGGTERNPMVSLDGPSTPGFSPVSFVFSSARLEAGVEVLRGTLYPRFTR